MNSPVIESIGEVSSMLNLSPLQTKSEIKQDFSQWLVSQVQETNDQIVSADTELRMLATGESDNLHHVMLSLEKAKTSMELVVQVRNKLLEGYQDIMRMQI